MSEDPQREPARILVKEILGERERGSSQKGFLKRMSKDPRQKYV
jgi:hypothetical protein